MAVRLSHDLDALQIRRPIIRFRPDWRGRGQQFRSVALPAKPQPRPRLDSKIEGVIAQDCRARRFDTDDGDAGLREGRELGDQAVNLFARGIQLAGGDP